MEVRITKLTVKDLPLVEKMSTEKLHATNTDENVFRDPYHEPVYKHFILNNDTYGSELFGVYGYFIDDVLMGVLGYRCLRNEPAWILSFVVTSATCSKPIIIIKELMSTVVGELENAGYFQWYVISKLEKFRAWQKLFKGARLNYHHYVYARTKANELPRWNSALGLSGNKLFPYDTNISMYISKKLCTTDDSGNTVDIDQGLL